MRPDPPATRVMCAQSRRQKLFKTNWFGYERHSTQVRDLPDSRGKAGPSQWACGKARQLPGQPSASIHLVVGVTVVKYPPLIDMLEAFNLTQKAYLVVVSQHPAQSFHIGLDHFLSEGFIRHVHIEFGFVVTLLPAILPQPETHQPQKCIYIKTKPLTQRKRIGGMDKKKKRV